MSRKLSVLFRFIFLLLFVLGFSPWSSPAYSAGQAPLAVCTEETPRIMPLGDSITRGSSSGIVDATLQVGFRKFLYDSLVTYFGGVNGVNFVGTLTNGENVPDFDPNHEGHAGWTAAQIAADVYNWLTNLGSDWPHIILLHIGTNGPDTPSEKAAQVEVILDEIDRFEYDTNNPITVILARIIDHEDHAQQVSDFNNLVETMAQGRINSLGDDIVIVDMEIHAGLNYELYTLGGDFFDNLHPWSSGYSKMADEWMIGLENVFSNCNNQPQITNPGNQSDAEGSSPSLQIEASDQDAGQTLTFNQIGLPPDLSIDPVTGLISGTIGYSAASGLPYSVTVTVQDNGTPARSNSVTFDWMVDNTNRPPDAENDTLDTEEDIHQDFTGADLLANDTDPDVSDALSVFEIDPNSQAGGTIENLGSGNYRYTPAANFNGTDQFTYTVEDGNGGSDTATVTVTVKPVNDAPVADVKSVSTGFETPVDITLTASDSDSENLTFEVVGPPKNGILSDTAPDLTYTPDAGYSGSDSFTFKAKDEDSYSNLATVSITITANNPPKVNDPGDQEDVEGEFVTLKLVASDEDPLDKLSYSISGQPHDLQIDPHTGNISGVLASGSAADSPYMVTVTVNDGHDTSAVVFTWTVQAHLFLPMITVFR